MPILDSCHQYLYEWKWLTFQLNNLCADHRLFALVICLNIQIAERQDQGTSVQKTVWGSDEMYP